MTAFTQGATDANGLTDFADRVTAYVRQLDDKVGLSEFSTILPPVVANAASWQLNGIAAFSGSTDIRLATFGSFVVGNAVYKQILTADGLSIAFEMESSGGSGADGFSFGFFDPDHTSLTTIGGAGGNLGVDNVPGVHVKYWDWSGGNVIEIRTVTASLTVTETNQVSPATRGIHEVAINLVRTALNTHNLTLVIDGVTIYSAVSTAITDKVRLALAGAVGGSDDNHYIRNFIGSAFTGGPTKGINLVEGDTLGSVDPFGFVVPRAFSGVSNRNRTASNTSTSSDTPTLSGDFDFTVVASGTAGAPVLPPAVPSAPLTTGRWQFEDPVTSAVYQFTVNPRTQGSLIMPPVLTEKQTTTGAPVTNEGQAKAAEMVLTGFVLTEAQYDALALWADKPYRVFLTDDLGRQFVAYTKAFQPTFAQSQPNNPWFCTYTLRVLIFGRAS